MISSFERDGGDMTERMQALKLMKHFITISPTRFPFGFARSLIAASSQPEDTFRRVAIETLRVLALANSHLVACCNGFKVLVEAIVDPALQDVSDGILMSILHLVSQPTSRVDISVAMDLRILLSAFTDMDVVEGKEYKARLIAAKTACVTVMRSWVGVIQLTSDPLGLRVLVLLLKDSKASPTVQDAILDTLIELFAPVVVKQKQLRIESCRMNEVLLQQSALNLNGSDGINGCGAVGRNGEHRRTGSGGNPPRGAPGGNGSGGSAFSSTSGVGTRSSVNLAAPPAVAESSWSSMFGGSRISGSRASLAGRPSTDLTSGGSAPESGGQDPTTERRMSRGFSSFFNKTSSSKAGGGTGSSAQTPTSTPSHSRRNSRSYPGSGEDSDHSSNDGDMIPARAVNAALRGVGGTGVDDKTGLGSDKDLMYNLMDHYAAILCSAFMHVDVISSLCYLGSHAETKLAAKACTLLVNILTIICGIFPEEKCTELLEIPALVEYAATVSDSNLMVTRSMKANAILKSVADAFSNYFAKHKMNRNYPHAEYSPLGLEGEGQTNGTVTAVTAAVGSNTQQQSVKSSQTGGNTEVRAVSQRQSVSGQQSTNDPKMFGPSVASARPSVGWVAADLKNSCKPRVDGLLLSCRGVSASTDLMYDLRHAITAAIDKTEFVKQMERSLVIGKEGKEPLKWDWQTIDDMLEYSFKNPERLSDALKTKWVKRVSGFYRCTVDEKAYFANSEWEYGNIIFLECACNMYHVLVGCDAGMMFLSGGDRRGMLFNEMSYELEQLVSSTTTHGWNGMGNATKNVFRMQSMTQTLSREYFTLLGRMTNTASGRTLLDCTQVFQHLSMLGHSRSLDYCSRLALTALSFTDNGHFSRNLLQIFTTSGGCSSELRSYTHTLLRALLRKSRNTEFVSWGVEMMMTQMIYFPSLSLAKVLEEAAQDRSYLKAMVAKKANFIGIPNAEKILMRYCAIPDGISFLKEGQWLDGALERWEQEGNDKYVMSVERALARVLSSCAKKGRVKEITTPIPVEADVFYTPSPTSALECGVCIDLEGLLRIPWNIEVKLSTTTQQQPGVTTALSAWEYLKIDSFLDASSLVSSACGESSSDQVRLVKVRGLVLDSTGVPSGVRVDSNRVITSALLCGINPVLRSGKVVRLSADSAKYAKAREKRAKAVQILKAEQLKASGGNFRGSMGASVLDGLPEPELPVTFQYEAQHDWSFCKPTHRGGKVTELGDDRFSVEIPNEPVVFIFARTLVKPKKNGAEENNTAGTSGTASSSECGIGANGRKPTVQRSATGATYLVEVHYYLRLCTDQDIFVPIPRHMYGELARNRDGIDILVSGNIIKRLLSTVTDEEGYLGKRRAALWALGQMGSTEYGFAAITAEMPSFIRFVIDLTVRAENYSLRGTGFFVLGLLGRSRGGMLCLAQEDWDVSPQVGVAVAIPREVSVLFQQTSAETGPEVADKNSSSDRYGHGYSYGIGTGLKLESQQIGGAHYLGFVTPTCAQGLRPFTMPIASATPSSVTSPANRKPSPPRAGRLPPKSPVPAGVSLQMPPLPPSTSQDSLSGLSINMQQVSVSRTVPSSSSSHELDATELLALNSIVKVSDHIIFDC